MTGRPRSRVLVEELEPIPARELARRPHADPLLVSLVVLAAHSLPDGRACSIPYARCPRCSARRRNLYRLGPNLGCVGCLPLTYQSKSERWDFPLMESMATRRAWLAGRPGCKGRRFHAWAQRTARVQRVGRVWLRAWWDRHGELLDPTDPPPGP